MRQKQTLTTLDKFTEAADKFDSVTTSIGKLNEIKDDIASSSEKLVKAQSDYVEQMTIPERVFEKVNAILNRITTFEENINALGVNIDQTQLLGNTQMNLIEEQLTAIKKKTNLAVTYQETTDEQLKGIYEEQSKAINAINAQYRAAIQKHGDDFEAAMSEFKTAYEKIVNNCKQAIEEKRDEYIQEIKKSLDLEAKNQYLAQLEKIPGMQETLTSISDSVKDPSAVLTKLDELKKEIGKIFSSSSISSLGGNSGMTSQKPYVEISRPNVPPTQSRDPFSQPRADEPAKHSESEPQKRRLFGIFGKRKKLA
jgi:ElaB/YqjD/DUF883 family membrane-anchored ribosome-binding protein